MRVVRNMTKYELLSEFFELSERIRLLKAERSALDKELEELDRADFIRAGLIKSDIEL